MLSIFHPSKLDMMKQDKMDRNTGCKECLLVSIPTFFSDCKLGYLEDLDTHISSHGPDNDIQRQDSSPLQSVVV